MSLIANSLKKAIKEKSLKVAPDINLLKNLGPKNKPKYDSKGIKRFVFLIFIPVGTLAYLLLENPFETNKNPQIIKPSVFVKTPPIKYVPKSAPSLPAQPVPPTSPSELLKNEPENILLIEPGMSEVIVLQNEEEEFHSKAVPGPKKEPVEALSQISGQEPIQGQVREQVQWPDQEPTQEKFIATGFEKKMQAKAKTSIKTKPADFKKAPKASAKVAASKTDKTSHPKIPGPYIVKDSNHYFNRAIFYQQSRSWEKALKNYSKAAKLNANDPDIYNNVGVIYKELRQYDQAIEEFLKAIDLNPEYTKPYNNIGVVYYAKKDYLGAIRNYQKATSIDPENLEALNNLAVAYKHTGQLDRSKAVLNQALAINPAHASTHYNLAVVYEKEGDIKSAVLFYQNFVELASSSHPTLSIEVKKHIVTLK